MGTRIKKFNVPTDAYVYFKASVYYDLEDGDMDGDWGAAIRASWEDSTAALEDDLVERSDTDSAEWDELIEVDITWNMREVEVCEWCGSPFCSGEPDECDEYTGEEEEEEDPDEEPPMIVDGEELRKKLIAQMINSLKDAPEIESKL